MQSISGTDADVAALQTPSSWTTRKDIRTAMTLAHANHAKRPLSALPLLQLPLITAFVMIHEINFSVLYMH